MNKFKFFILSVIMPIVLVSSIQAQVECPLACQELSIVVVPNSTDLVEVLPEQVLVGDYSGCSNFDPVVTINYLFTNDLHPTSPSVGEGDLDGQPLQVSVTDLTTGNVCWSRLQVLKEGALELRTSSSYGILGGQICIPVMASNFVYISRLSTSFTWDPSVMTYDRIEYGAIWPTTSDLSKIDEGKLGFSWLNNGAAPVNWVREGEPLFTICFEAIAETDGSDVCFGDSPTPSEIISDNQGDVDPSLICGEAIIASCSVKCFPELTVTLQTADEERTLANDYTLLRLACPNAELNLSITDTAGTNLGTTVTAEQVGQSLTATLVDNGSGTSCETDLTVAVCEAEILNIEVDQRFDGSNLVADIRVDNFSEVTGYQFTLNYDPEILSFNEFLVGDDSDFSPSLNSSMGNGQLLVVNVPSDGIPITLADGSVLLSVVFSILEEENTTLYFGSDPVELLFIDNFMNDLCVNAPPKNLSISGAGVVGKIYDDINKDCAADATDLLVQNWLVELIDQNTGDSYYGNSDEDGNYLVYAPPGTYTLTAYSASDLWAFCGNGMTVTIQNDEEKIEQDFFAQADILCPDLSVDVSTPFLRRCFNNTYHLSYCNDGTTAASEAFITVELDPYMSFVNSATPYTVSGQSVTFDIGDMPYGTCETLKFTVLVDCDDTTIGQTHCVEAQIYPVVDCFTSDPEWSGASLEITGECDGQNLDFTITNVGIGDMTKSLDFIVIEDDVMREGGTIELGAGESYDLAPLPADGSTYRVSIPQVEKHPGASAPTVAIEGCGTNDAGSFSTGFVTMFSENDGNGNIDIDCQENIGSWDPNDKAVAPKGYTDKKYVSANTDLDYKIRFQNTGTDTAFRVIVKDVIEDDLDLSTLVLGAASHDYELTIEGRTLVFTFDDIMLVDSTRNEPASHGFIKFKIAQNADMPDGTFLTNDADIFFDFNEAVETNVTELEIGTPDGTFNKDLVDIDLTIFPNPTADKVSISHDYNKGKVTFKIYDQLGKLVLMTDLEREDNISLEAFPVGIYEYRMTSGKKVLSKGKISKM